MSKVGNGGPLSEGWIARHRSVRGHWLVGHGIHVKPADPSVRRCHSQGEAWEDILMECRYADGHVMNGGKRMELRRGELLGAVSWLASRWNWTPKVVRRFLDQLEIEGMIEMKNPAHEKGNQIGRQANVLNVCKYDEYQYGGALDGQSEGQPQGNHRATTGQPQGNNIRKNKETRETSKNPLPPNGGEVDRKSINRAAARDGFVLWQDTAKRCGLPVPRETSFDVYGQKIAARMFEHADSPRGVAEMVAVWAVAMANIEKSSFLRGLDGKGFRADLKFICQRESFEKLITTGYGNGAHAPGARSEIAAIVGNLADRKFTLVGDGDEMAIMREQISKRNSGGDR